MFQRRFCGDKCCGIFVFLIIVQLFKTSEAWFEYCDQKVVLQPNQSMYVINSPGYPNRYPPGSSCRYTVVAPLDYEINIQCNIKIDKTSQQCTSDFLYIAVNGDPELRGSEYFCGEGYVQRKSQFNKLVLAYTSSTNKYAGQFSCLVQATPQPCDCGWSVQMRIVNGVETKINEFPFMTAILHNPSNIVFCGGSIISHRYVVTAAHCLTNYRNPADLSVVVGDHDLRTGAETPYTQIHRVTLIKIHEMYNSNSDYNDIALLGTATVIEWSRGVGPVCLPLLYSFSTFANMNADIVGWGTTSFGGATSPVLRKATVKIISNQECQQDFGNQLQIINSEMCTFSPPKDSCQFDSGGPVVVRLDRMFLAGLISFGGACGSNSPSVNTRITSFLNWIQVNTRENFCQKS